MLCSELAVLNEEEYFCRHKAFWNSSRLWLFSLFT